MNKNVRLMIPSISYSEVEEDFQKVFESGIFTRGSYVESFRKELNAYVGSQYAFMLTSATTALWTCLRLLDIGPGDEVIVSDFSFPASANVIEDVGATPIFADVSLDTYNMLPEELSAKITEKTKAVIFVDALGNPAGIHEIKKICQQHNIPLIEDAACAIGSSENGVRCGSIADLTCFSFHPRKLICAGEGGAITTNNAEWADWLETKLLHGACGTKGLVMDFVDYGYNFRLTELQAIMASSQLKKLDQIIDSRNQIRDSYIAELSNYGFKPQYVNELASYNVQSLVFRVPAGVDRDRLILALRKVGIESTIGTYALSAGKFYLEKYNSVQENSNKLEQTTITFPCFEGVDSSFVIETLRTIV